MLPPASLAQRARAMSDGELMFAATRLAKGRTAAEDQACIAVLEELEARIPAPTFEAFLAEIYR